MSDRGALRLGFGTETDASLHRAIAVEAPVAIEYNGIGYAVMMATPADLAELAIGLALSDGVAADAGEIGSTDVHAVSGGWVVRCGLASKAIEPVLARARNRMTESGCGLCGIESIEAVLASFPPLASRLKVRREGIASALAALSERQQLMQATGASHAAAFCSPDGRIFDMREDVGRHNAMDKLIGAMALAGEPMSGGFLLVTSRCSFELVEKAVRAQCPMLVSVSAPTSLAIDRARRAGLALAALARHDSMLVLHDPGGSFE